MRISRFVVVPVVLSSLVACGTPPAESPASTTSQTLAPASAARATSETARDPKIMQLAQNAATQCKFEDEYFEDECAALAAWKENEELFAEGKGDATVWSMFGDKDIELRVLAAERGLSDSRAFFASKARAQRLFELAGRETHRLVVRQLGSYVTYVDTAKLGLDGPLLALAKSPNAELRTSLAWMLSRQQSPAVLELHALLLEDADKNVQREAISNLSSGGVTPPVPEVCAMLKKQISRTDDGAGSALWAASSSKCEGMKALVISELTARVKKPAAINNALGVSYSLAAGGLCHDYTTPAEHKAGFAIAQELVKVQEPNTQYSALSTMAGCDPAAASKVLATLSKDKKNPKLASDAEKKLAELKQRAVAKK